MIDRRPSFKFSALAVRLIRKTMAVRLIRKTMVQDPLNMKGLTFE